MRESFIINLSRFVLILALSYSAAFSFGQKLNTEDFYSFPRSEKVKLIKNMQMFSVNLEQFHIDRMSRKYSYQEIRFILEKLVPSAIADEAIQSDKFCMYAGWVSYIPKNAGKKGYCTHPSRFNQKDVPKALKKVIAEETKRYKAFNKEFYPTGCSSRHKIMCNPQLYGTDPSTSKPFCVVGNPQPQNSSFQCLRAFERHEKKEEIMDQIIEKNMDADNGQRLQTLISMIDDACMCQGAENKIDKSYATRLFKTQTCFAWVAQVKNVSKKVCSKYDAGDESLSPILDFSKDIYQRANNQLIKTDIDSDEYVKIIESKDWLNTNWEKKRSEFDDFCKEEEEEQTPTVDLDEVLVIAPKTATKAEGHSISIKQKPIEDSHFPVDATALLDKKAIEDFQAKGYHVKWFLDEVENPDLEGLNPKVPAKDETQKIIAKLYKGDKEFAVSNELELEKPEDDKADDTKYSITIAKLTAKGKIQPLESTVKIGEEEMTLEQLGEKYIIKWYELEATTEKKDEAKKEDKKDDKEDTTEEEPEYDELGEKIVKDKKAEPAKEEEGKNLIDYSADKFTTEKVEITTTKKKVVAMLFEGDEFRAQSAPVEIQKLSTNNGPRPPGFRPMQMIRARSTIHRGNR